MGTLTSDMLSPSLLICASSRVFIKKDYEASKNTSIMRKKKPTVYFYLFSKYSAKFALQLNKYLKLPIILVRKAKLLGAL